MIHQRCKEGAQTYGFAVSFTLWIGKKMHLQPPHWTPFHVHQRCRREQGLSKINDRCNHYLCDTPKVCALTPLHRRCIRCIALTPLHRRCIRCIAPSFMCYISNVRKQISEAVEAVGNRGAKKLNDLKKVHITHQRCKKKKLVHSCSLRLSNLLQYVFARCTFGEKVPWLR